VAAFFAGLDLVEPGVVPVDAWRREAAPDGAGPVLLYGAAGRKP
jgi:S-adenosyl methyltransferase